MQNENNKRDELNIVESLTKTLLENVEYKTDGNGMDKENKVIELDFDLDNMKISER